MEEKKNIGNVLTIILVFLLLIAVGTIGYFIGSNKTKENNLNNNEIKEEDKQEDEVIDEITPVAYTPKCVDSSAKENVLMTDIDDTKYNNIVEYIQEQENVKVLINHCKYDENNVAANEYGFVAGTYELTKLEQKNVFNEIKNSIFEITQSGIGGACVSDLEITYERNNKKYYILYYQLFAMTSNDGNIYKILDKTVNNTLEQPKDCLYHFDNLSNTANSILNGLRNS